MLQVQLQDAQDAASLLAGASGCKITGVQSINEYTPMVSQVNDYMMLKSSVSNDSPATTIKEGLINVSSQVNITFTIEN